MSRQAIPRPRSTLDAAKLAEAAKRARRASTVSSGATLVTCGRDTAFNAFPQCLVRLEVWPPFRRDRRCCSRPGIAPRSGAPATDTEAAESPNLDPAAGGQRRLQGIEQKTDASKAFFPVSWGKRSARRSCSSDLSMTGFYPSAAPCPALIGSRTGLPPPPPSQERGPASGVRGAIGVMGPESRYGHCHRRGVFVTCTGWQGAAEPSA